MFAVISCAHNPYDNASPEKVAKFKEVSIPFASGTSYRMNLGPYQGNNRHYSWGFEVPFGTPVQSMDSGKIISVHQPEGGGGCDPKKYLNKGHNVRVLHDDGSVAQYLHVDIKVKENDVVQKGQVIALTANNGVVCNPHLHVMVYETKYDVKPSGTTIPLRFKGIPQGILTPGNSGIVP